MDNTIALIITCVVIVGIVAWRAIAEAKQGRRWNFDRTLDEFDNVVELVRKFAPAADQLVKLGELKPDERRAHVVEMVKEVLTDVDPQLVIQVVEWWVATQKYSTPDAE